MTVEELALLHKALSVPARLRILELIAERPRCVNNITQAMSISQPAVSQHLAVLRRANLAIPERRGYRTHYSANAERLAEFRRAMAAFAREQSEKAHADV